MANTRKHCQGYTHIKIVNLSFSEWIEGLVDHLLMGQGSRVCKQCGLPCTSVSAQTTYTGLLVDWLCEDGHEFTQFRAFETLQKDYERADHTVLKEDVTEYPYGRKC